MSDWSFCPKCGSKLELTDSACRVCGAVTPTAPTVPLGEGPTPVPEPDLAALEAELGKALSPSFVLVRRLGAGGMGSVFLARDPALKRLVAVKVLAPALAADEGSRSRFEREAQAVARLSHPNIVAIHSVGQLEGDGTPYFVMQYVDGRSLAERLKEEGPFAVEDARQVIGEVASALAIAHAQGIIHRDIKPANILYDEDSGRVLVSDFGIAAVRPKEGDAAETQLTQTGMALGTPQYMSPEQLLAENVTEKTDLYALGLLGYELLTGAGPFAATSPQELIAAHLRDTPKVLSEVRDDIDPELESVIAACLDKDPAERPSAREVAQRFTAGADLLLEWPPPGLATLHGRLRSVNRFFWTGSLLTAVGVIALLTFGSGVSSVVISLATLLIGVVLAAGVVVLAAGARVLFRVAGEATQALRAGFGWITIAETAADRRGDAGALIVGLREYAALAPKTREMLRKGRVLRELMLLAGGLLPVFALVPGVWLAVGGLLGVAAVPIVLLGPSVILVAVAIALSDRETRKVGPARERLRRHRGSRERDPRLVTSWMEVFERVRRGQSLGPGPRSRPVVSRLGAVGLALALLMVIIALAPIGFVGVMGPRFWSVPNLSSAEARLRFANIARSFVLPPDSSITPLEAGQALYILFEAGHPPSDPFSRPLPRQYAESWGDLELPEGLFAREIRLPGRERPSNARVFMWGVPDPEVVLEYAASGLSGDETRYLEHLAALPLWTEYRTVARAPAMDYLGARFVLPFPDSVTWGKFPIPRFTGTKGAAYASISKAAFFLAEARYDEAETTLRETVSFGFKLVDEGSGLIETLLGSVIVGIGRDALERFYALTDRPEAALLRARYDSVRALVDELQQVRGDSAVSNVASIRRYWLRLAQDTTQLRGLRMEAFYTLGFAPCTNARELIFGPGEDIQAAVAQARRDLFRFPSEEAALELMLETPERLASTDWDLFSDKKIAGLIADDLVSPFLRGIVRISGWMLGNERILGCTALHLNAL